MGFNDRLVGRKLPCRGTAPASSDALRCALLALERDTAPYTVRVAAAGEAADVVAEWKIADPRWSAVFERAGVDADLALLLRIREAAQEVRCLQRSRSVTWRDGRPVPTAGVALVLGRSVDVAFGMPPAFVEATSFGESRSYRFVASEIRRPLETIVRRRGWIWRGAGLDGLRWLGRPPSLKRPRFGGDA